MKCRELAYYCSEAYFVGIIADAPKEFNDLANMMIENYIRKDTGKLMMPG